MDATLEIQMSVESVGGEMNDGIGQGQVHSSMAIGVGYEAAVWSEGRG